MIVTLLSFFFVAVENDCNFMKIRNSTKLKKKKKKKKKECDLF